MRIGIIGAGYVGLVTGVCFADVGNDVIVADIDKRKIDALKSGRSPHFEPGLNDLLTNNIKAGRLHFSLDPVDAVKNRNIIFLAVGTPPGPDGAADLSQLEGALKTVAKNIAKGQLVVIKSTVPPGTNRKMAALAKTITDIPVDIASNPEFLKEGAAIQDFTKPDRVVIGTSTPEAESMMRLLYAPFIRPRQQLLATTPESAEMIKYASNALLASRISFMNEMSRICQAIGADIDQVRSGVGMDKRLGSAFLYAGLGYGGSCFPKDVRALAHLAESLGLSAPLCRAIDKVNADQADFFVPSMEHELGGANWTGKKIALWGLAYKPQTDDIREAPALHIARNCLGRGAIVSAYDPEAAENARRELSIHFAGSRDEVLDQADALVVCTEWNEFRSPDFELMRDRMRRPLIFDGRNLYPLSAMRDYGFTYYSIGRETVNPGI